MRFIAAKWRVSQITFWDTGTGALPSHVFRVPFLVSLTTLECQAVCHIYQWVAHPSHGSVCNHCERKMDGFTMDDLISGNGTGSLTEDVVVRYVRAGDPTNQDWDDWPLRMTFRINSFLRANRDNSEPDFSDFECFLGTHCLLRHHTQWIRPLHIGLYHTSIPTLIRLSTSF